MALILNIETSTKNCSVALAQNGKTLALKQIAEDGYLHAEYLHKFIDDVFKQSNFSLNNLNAVAISKGPGSYTGLRIGVSAAKGLCFALNIPLISLETLTILAHSLARQNGTIVPMIDARRMEVYTAIYSSKLKCLQPAFAHIISDDFLQNLEQPIHLLGDGIEKTQNIFTDSKFIFHKHLKFPSAKEMSKLSYEKYNAKQFEDLAYFEPYYLKDFLIQKT